MSRPRVPDIVAVLQPRAIEPQGARRVSFGVSFKTYRGSMNDDERRARKTDLQRQYRARDSASEGNQ